VKKKIAIIDQEEDITDIISCILTEVGHEPYRFTCIDDLTEATVRKPDLIILNDWLLTDQGQNIREVIKLPDAAGIPVMIISDKPDSKRKAIVHQADEVLPMPFDIGDLVGKVSKLLK
jgi:DNA-binding response OmpR family regulator